MTPGSAEEKHRREQLWNHLHKFVREHGAWIISVPAGRVTVQIPKESRLLEELRQLKHYPVAEVPGNATRLAHGAFVPVDTIEVRLWRD